MHEHARHGRLHTTRRGAPYQTEAFAMAAGRAAGRARDGSHWSVNRARPALHEPTLCRQRSPVVDCRREPGSDRQADAASARRRVQPIPLAEPIAMRRTRFHEARGPTTKGVTAGATLALTVHRLDRERRPDALHQIADKGSRRRGSNDEVPSPAREYQFRSRAGGIRRQVHGSTIAQGLIGQYHLSTPEASTAASRLGRYRPAPRPSLRSLSFPSTCLRETLR